MCQTIRCIKCSKEIQLLDKVAADIIFNNGKSNCEKCGDIKTYKQSYNFCSLDCFHTFVGISDVSGKSQIK